MGALAKATMANPHGGLLQLGHWTARFRELRLDALGPKNPEADSEAHLLVLWTSGYQRQICGGTELKTGLAVWVFVLHLLHQTQRQD